ncbi:MAG: 2-deoxyribose-5-phosphate aldolase, partial [Thermoplasmatales archaeon]
MNNVSVEKILGLVDHTKLKPYETEDGIRSLIEEALELKTYSICIEPVYLELAREIVDNKNLGLKIAVVVDFPFGAGSTEARIKMINEYSDKADELDIVAQIGLVKSGRFDLVDEDLKKVVRASHDNGRI